MAAGVGTRPIVAVFGSSQPRRGDELYKSSLLMGALLGRYGFDVVTGGYKGVMEAVSRGAHGNGAHVVGVTMARFADRVNRYVMDEIRADNFAERFRWLVDRADAYVAMGGIGTLVEVTFTWQELQLGMLSKRPLVLVGPRWRALFKCFAEQLIPSRGIFESMTLVDTPEQAAEFLCRQFWAQAHPSTSAANGRPNGGLLRPANYSDIDRELKPRQNAVIRGFDLSLYYAGLNRRRARRYLTFASANRARRIAST